MNFQVDYQKEKLFKAEKDNMDNFINDVEKSDAVIESEKKEEHLLDKRNSDEDLRSLDAKLERERNEQKCMMNKESRDEYLDPEYDKDVIDRIPDESDIEELIIEN